MYVFIDTNIFLSFYHLTSEDLEELEKLFVLIKNKELTLFLPHQVINETKRNRASKINSALANFKDAKFKISFPSYCKDYKEYKEMNAALLVAKKLHDEMLVSIEKDINSNSLKADLLLKKIFEIAQLIELTPTIFDAAQKRVALGNPPGKRDSLGDAINWECLLQASPKSFSLHLISDDSDFCSALNPNLFHDYLEDEWKSEKKYEVLFYRKISDFFKKNYPNINLKAESEKDSLIEALSLSGSFAQTHALIAKLSSYDGFTIKQAEDLVIAAMNNNQVKWIMDDEDVYKFYKKLDQDNFFVLNDEFDEFLELLKQSAPQIAA